MWILQKLNNEEVAHHLICGSTLIVGRTGNDFISLPGDKSVSKRHASFFLSHEEPNICQIECLPKIILTDLKSSNGTYIKKSSTNFIRILPERPENLQHGNIIRFGKENTWKVLYEPFIVTTSMIGKETKLLVKSSMQILGGHVVKEWQEECKHLVMDGLKLSAKTVSALASGAHIVMPSYLTNMLNAIKEKTPIPSPQDYLPPLQELSINAAEVSFFPDSQRKTLFSGKKFWFQTKDSYKRMSCIIKAAGGDYHLLTEGDISKVLLEDNILVKPPEKEMHTVDNTLFHKAAALLNENRLTMVPESDVGLAITYKSILKYCNPKFHANGILRARGNGAQMTQSLKIFATETQPESLPLPSHPVSRTTIFDSGASSKGKISSLSKLSGKSTPGKVQTDKPGTSGDSSKAKVSSTGESSLPVVCLEDKENFGKRKRSPNAEKTSSSKRDSSYLMKTSVLSNTELIDLTEDVNECGSFNPIHFSTQNEPPKNIKDSFLAPGPIAQNVQMVSPPDKQAKALPPLDSSFPSIPFQPYTLPSIRVEDFPTAESPPVNHMDEDDDGELTQSFTRASLLEEEPPRGDSEEKKGTKTNEMSSWIGGHNTTTVVAETPSGSATKSKNSERFETRKGNSKARRARSPVVDEGEFALPFTSERRKRRRDVSDNENQSLLCSLKEPQPSKQMKLESKPEPPSNQSGGENDVVLREIKRRPSEEDRESRNIPQSEQEKENLRPFVSKQECVVERENAGDEIAELGNSLEKSLVVVRVLNLVKKKASTPAPTSASNGLPNFKKFKKVLASSMRRDQDDVSFLPRIIGGRDLVSHSACDNRRETFLASQPGLVQHLERMEEERRTDAEDELDSDFTLLRSRPNQKRRGRL